MKFFPKRDSTMRLRDVIGLSRSGEILHSIPDRLASVIARYDATATDPHFRHDVYNVLNGSLDIAEALVDETFSVDHAMEQLARQLDVLSRVIRYLNSRPMRSGFSILIPKTHHLIGQFATQEEAESALTNMRSMGATQDAIIVPVKITSQHAVQPKEVPEQQETSREAASREAAESSPLPRSLQSTIEHNAAEVSEPEETEGVTKP